MEQPKRPEKHKIIFENRSQGMLTGIVDVISFDVDEIQLESQYGTIVIKGSDLHIKRLNLEIGEIDIEGEVVSIVYTKTKARRKRDESVIKKLFG